MISILSPVERAKETKKRFKNLIHIAVRVSKTPVVLVSGNAKNQKQQKRGNAPTANFEAVKLDVSPKSIEWKRMLFQIRVQITPGALTANQVRAQTNLNKASSVMRN